MTDIIITDLTRFKNPEIVCIAGTDLSTGRCIRPMPYISKKDCERLNILPGAILSGDFTPARNLEGPHQEDMTYNRLNYRGSSTSAQFRTALEAQMFASVEEGFETHLTAKQKHIPHTDNVGRSIITVTVDPNTVRVVDDEYEAGKLKLHFVDQSGHAFRYIGITDLGFHNYAQRKHKEHSLHEVNEFVSSQEEVYLRIGLSRRWKSGDADGYWLQVNGIYTFPNFLQELRSHK